MKLIDVIFHDVSIGLEKVPEGVTTKSEIIKYFCPSDFYHEIKRGKCGNTNCIECWNREYLED